MKQEETPGELGRLLRQAFTEKTPPSLDIVIMQKIRAEEQRRAYRRMAIAFALKIAVFLAAVIVLLWPVFANVNIAKLVGQTPTAINSSGDWLLRHAVRILVFAALLFFGRLLFNPRNRPYDARGKSTSKI